MMRRLIIIIYSLSAHAMHNSDATELLRGLETGILNWEIRKLVINDLMNRHQVDPTAIRIHNCNTTLESLGHSSFRDAVSNEDENMVAQLLPHFKKYNDRDTENKADQDKKNALLFGVNKASIANLLFEYGSSPLAINEQGETPLHKIVRCNWYCEGFRDLITTFVAHGMPIDRTPTNFNALEMLILRKRDSAKRKENESQKDHEALEAIKAGVSMRTRELEESLGGDLLPTLIQIVVSYDMAKVEYNEDDTIALYAKDDAWQRNKNQRVVG